MSATQDIVAKLWNLCNVLRDDGVTYLDWEPALSRDGPDGGEGTDPR